MSEFGYDYIGQFILIYLFLEYIYNDSKVRELKFKEDSIIFFLYAVLIKV